MPELEESPARSRSILSFGLAFYFFFAPSSVTFAFLAARFFFRFGTVKYNCAH